MLDDDLKVNIRPGDEDTKPVENLWFEIAMEDACWAVLYIGADTGSRGVTQTLRLALSNLGRPFADLAALAEHAYAGVLPFTIEIDSEGPESRLSITPISNGVTALFEVRDIWEPAVYLAAEVNPKKTGIALSHALRVAVAHPDNAERWASWYSDDRHTTATQSDYLGSTWLRELTIPEHPSGKWYFSGIDTWNGTHYPWSSTLKDDSLSEPGE